MMPQNLAENCVVSSTASTNLLARELAEAGRPEGTWVAAEVQTGGRGRGAHQWVSDKGNLFLSLVSRVEDRSLWTWIPLAAAVSLRRAALSLKPDLLGELKIKWPNDLYLDEGKAAGVLCETVGSAVVIGVGANCASAPSIPGVVTRSLGIDCHLLREVFLAEIQAVLRDLRNRGPGFLRTEYESASFLLPGDEVSWGDSSEGVGLRRGKVLGLGQFGELRVTPMEHAEPRSETESVSLYSEEIQRLRKS
jgi:biotin-[acetyl-CoA-carboxylase] ligase BirA-like protein